MSKVLELQWGEEKGSSKTKPSQAHTHHECKYPRSQKKLEEFDFHSSLCIVDAGVASSHHIPSFITLRCIFQTSCLHYQKKMHLNITNNTTFTNGWKVFFIYVLQAHTIFGNRTDMPPTTTTYLTVKLRKTRVDGCSPQNFFLQDCGCILLIFGH